MFNRDFPEEWFTYINEQLNEIGASIIDVKIYIDEMKSFHTYLHIQSDSTFFRYFIAQAISGEKALYLDCDLVVNTNLDGLFKIELGEHYILACLDNLALAVRNERVFNAGVMLINLPRWRNENIAEQALTLTAQMQNNLDKIPDADQSILNILFKDKWLELNYTYNYQIGGEYIFRKNNALHLLTRKENEIPAIMHYNTEFKPWKLNMDLPFRDFYWFYYKLNWKDIINHHKEFN